MARLAVDASSLYWTNLDGGYVSTLALAGGGTKQIAGPFDDVRGLSQDADAIYFGVNKAKQPGKLMRSTKVGHVATTVAANSVFVQDSAVVGNCVVWTDSYGGILWKTAKAN